MGCHAPGACRAAGPPADTTGNIARNRRRGMIRKPGVPPAVINQPRVTCPNGDTLDLGRPTHRLRLLAVAHPTAPSHFHHHVPALPRSAGLTSRRVRVCNRRAHATRRGSSRQAQAMRRGQSRRAPATPVCSRAAPCPHHHRWHLVAVVDTTRSTPPRRRPDRTRSNSRRNEK